MVRSRFDDLNSKQVCSYHFYCFKFEIFHHGRTMRSLDRTIGSLMTACNFKCIQFKLVLLLARYEWCIICETRHVMGLHVRITSLPCRLCPHIMRMDHLKFFSKFLNLFSLESDALLITYFIPNKHRLFRFKR